MEQWVIALAGNPNVGKSTVFNQLTGMNQHTGNWPGKTVEQAKGRYGHRGQHYELVDLPGTYSLQAHSAEEQIARDFICFGGADVTVVVCDATSLERSLNLALQTIEISKRMVICVNLMDEAKKKGIQINLDILSQRLGVPVVGTSARNGKGLDKLRDAVAAACQQEGENAGLSIHYPHALEQARHELAQALEALPGIMRADWVALRMLAGDVKLAETLAQQGVMFSKEIEDKIALLQGQLDAEGMRTAAIEDVIVSSLIAQAEQSALACVCYGKACYDRRDRRLDRFLMGKWTGIPMMILMLAGVFWLTISGANAPSRLLSEGFYRLEELLRYGLASLGTPGWLSGALLEGIYRTLTWVIAVMLPPMAIFFPLFTLLEDFGYLPRVAFNLDKWFKRSHACGKQALTMCMGFGCNAVGVTGCRIIDSPRERLIAILTNCLVPCNGRFAPPRKAQQNGSPGLIIKRKPLNFSFHIGVLPIIRTSLRHTAKSAG